MHAYMIQHGHMAVLLYVLAYQHNRDKPRPEAERLLRPTGHTCMSSWSVLTELRLDLTHAARSLLLRFSVSVVARVAT